MSCYEWLAVKYFISEALERQLEHMSTTTFLSTKSYWRYNLMENKSHLERVKVSSLGRISCWCHIYLILTRKPFILKMNIDFHSRAIPVELIPSCIK
jgi:hypothetical protein